MRVVLASASPRRKELFKKICPSFEILPAKGEEKSGGTSPEEVVEELAKAKAKEVFFSLDEGEKIVLGADTVVVSEGKILGKPKDANEAKKMLFALSGKVHFVLTGVSFFYSDGKSVFEKTTHAKTEVWFEELTASFIDEYIASGSPLDKAGAYGIQDGGLVKEIKGSYSNVVGLPVELCQTLWAEITKKGVGV